MFLFSFLGSRAAGVVGAVLSLPLVVDVAAKAFFGVEIPGLQSIGMELQALGAVIGVPLLSVSAPVVGKKK